MHGQSNFKPQLYVDNIIKEILAYLVFNNFSSSFYNAD